jgi:hypothetical protein
MLGQQAVGIGQIGWSRDVTEDVARAVLEKTHQVFRVARSGD